MIATKNVNFNALVKTCLSLKKFILSPTSKRINETATAVMNGLSCIIMLFGVVCTNLNTGPISKPISIRGTIDAIFILLNKEFNINPKNTREAKKTNNIFTDSIQISYN